MGTWTSAAWSPVPGTQMYGLVKRIWYFDGSLVIRRERVFPDGSIEIIVQLDEPHRPGSADAERFPPICITGLRLTAEVVVAPAGRCRVIGIVLSPPCAHAVLRESLLPFTGLTASLQDVIGRQASELAERLDDARDPKTVILAARSWLAERIDRAPDAQRTFRELFGTTPKRFERILRFRRTLEALTRGDGSLADVACAEGYYDQAHFTNDFRQHAGMSPGAFLRASVFPTGTHVAER
jgi:AraC-like DNA-binding protein